MTVAAMPDVPGIPDLPTGDVAALLLGEQLAENAALATIPPAKKKRGRPRLEDLSEAELRKIKDKRLYAMACQRQGLDQKHPERAPQRSMVQKIDRAALSNVRPVPHDQWLALPFEWNDATRLAAERLAGGGRLRAVAAQCGVKPMAVAKWREHLEFRAEVARLANEQRGIAAGGQLAALQRNAGGIADEIERRIDEGDLGEMTARELLAISTRTADAISKLVERLDRRVERQAKTAAKMVEKIVAEIDGMDDGQRLAMAMNQKRILDLIKNRDGVFAAPGATNTDTAASAAAGEETGAGTGAAAANIDDIVDAAPGAAVGR